METRSGFRGRRCRPGCTFRAGKNTNRERPFRIKERKNDLGEVHPDRARLPHRISRGILAWNRPVLFGSPPSIVPSQENVCVFSCRPFSPVVNLVVTLFWTSSSLAFPLSPPLLFAFSVLFLDKLNFASWHQMQPSGVLCSPLPSTLVLLFFFAFVSFSFAPPFCPLNHGQGL